MEADEGPPPALLAALQDMAQGRLTTALDERDDAWAPVVQLLRQIQTRWKGERRRVFRQIALAEDALAGIHRIQGKNIDSEVPTSERQSEATPAPVSGAAALTSSARVLVIDDDRLIVACAKRYLRRYDVTVFDNGRDAMAFIASGEPLDVIFCDLMMPDKTGMDILDEVSAIRPELQDRFVFWTGGVFAPETISFIEDLSSPCITKPFKAKELVVHVEQMIRRQNTQL